MNNLILKATENNPTTIIPNFGAIMKMGKTFMYNEFLKYDDGKFAKFISEEKGVEESEAKVLVASWVEALQKSLNGGEVVIFDGIGELSRVDGKMKFTAKADVSSSHKEVSSLVESKEEEKVTPPKEEPAKTLEVLKTIETSADYKAKEAVEMIEKFTDKSELINFTRGETRKTVVAALNTRLDELNGKRKDLNKDIHVPTEVKPPRNVVNEVVVETKKEDSKPLEVIEEKEEKSIEPVIVPEDKKIEEKSHEVTPVVVSEPKTIEKSPEVVVTSVKEEKTIKEIAATIEKPLENNEEEEAAIAAIVNGVEQTEKQTGKRKKRWILWVGLLLILLGGGAVGYLKKDLIMGWFDKKHEPKDLAEAKEETVPEPHEDQSALTHIEHQEEAPVEEHETESEIQPEEVVEDPVVVEVVEVEPPIEEPKVKETPVVNNSTEGSWHIIAGSYSSKENAENKVKSLNEAGYSSAKVLGKYNGLYTVRVASYATKDEAKSALSSYTGSGNSGFIKNL